MNGGKTYQDKANRKNSPYSNSWKKLRLEDLGMKAAEVGSKEKKTDDEPEVLNNSINQIQPDNILEKLREKRAKKFIAKGNEILYNEFPEQIAYSGQSGIVLKLKRNWVNERLWKYYAEYLEFKFGFPPIPDYESFLALDDESSKIYFNIPATLIEFSPAPIEKEEDIPESTAEKSKKDKTATDSWTLYKFSYEEPTTDLSTRKQWEDLSTEEIVTEKLGLDYASVLNEFKKANPNDERWMDLWIKRSIINKGWSDGDAIPSIREVEVWEDPDTGEPVIEAFSFSDARNKAKEIGVQDFDTFYWKRKISGKKEHFMRGYQGPEIYYNQKHLSGQDYQQMVGELYKVSGDYSSYQNALEEGKIGQAFVDLVKAAQEVVFFNKSNLEDYRDGMFGNDTKKAIDNYLNEIKRRDPYWEAMIRRFAREKSITLEKAREITAGFWDRPDVAEKMNKAYEEENLLKLYDPGYDTNLKVAMANQPEYIKTEMSQKFSIYRVAGVKAELESELQTELDQVDKTDKQIADELIEKHPPPESFQNLDNKTNQFDNNLFKGGFYDPESVPLYDPYIAPAGSLEVAPNYFIWDNSSFNFDVEKHLYTPEFDPNADYSDQLIQRFEYWKKWENEEAEMKQIKQQSQTVEDQSSEITDADDQFINYLANELGYAKPITNEETDDQGIIYLSPLEKDEQKTFYEAWLKLKLKLIMLPESQKKSGKLPSDIIKTYEEFEQLLFAHGDAVSYSDEDESEFENIPDASLDTLFKSPENFEEIELKVEYFRQVILTMLKIEFQKREGASDDQVLKNYTQQKTEKLGLISKVQKAKTNAEYSGHTFEKIQTTFEAEDFDPDREQSFAGPYHTVQAKGQELNMYVEKNDEVVVHLFLGSNEESHFQFTGSSIYSALNEMNDVKGVLPPGIIRYQTENGWYNEFKVDPPSWTWSEALGVASIVLAVIAIPVTGGASVVLVVGATAAGVASSGFYLYEEDKKGQLSSSDVWRESGFMLANLLPMVRGISTLAKLSKTSGKLSKIGKVVEGYTYLQASIGVGIGATTVEGVIIADSYMTKFDEIDKMQISDDEKDLKREHLLREGLITGLITITGFIDAAGLKKTRNSSRSKHWSGKDTDVSISGKKKSTDSSIKTEDGHTTQESSGSAEQAVGAKGVSESTQQTTTSDKKKTTVVFIVQDADGNFFKQNNKTRKFEKISKEEFDKLDATTKSKGGDVVKSEKSGKFERVNFTTNIDGKVKVISKEKLFGNQPETFLGGEYSTVESLNEITLFRHFGGDAKIGGTFMTTTPNVSRENLALVKDFNNTMRFEAEIIVPSGEKLNIGKVGPWPPSKPELSGGADQVIVKYNYPEESWVKSIKDNETGEIYTYKQFKEVFPDLCK